VRILLIGGSGFIGPHVARTLEQQGHDVIVFHRGHTPARHEIVGDRRALAEHEIEWERAHPTTSSPHAFDYDAEDAALLQQ
jgi:nucleoside-diphosphate-sugar epimerase